MRTTRNDRSDVVGSKDLAGWVEAAGPGAVTAIMEQTEAMRLGYTDSAHGLPTSERYERASREWQANYETGRLIACTLMDCALPLVSWPAWTPLPLAVEMQFAAAVKLKGATLAGARLPPDPALEFSVALPGRARGRRRRFRG